MEDKEEEIKNSLIKLHDGLNDLTVAMIGDERFKRRGIVHDIEDMKVAQASQSDEIKKIKNNQYKATVIGTTIGAGIGWLLKSAKMMFFFPFK
jgi:ribosomal protein L1